jgi:hypothetical protein
LCDFLITNSWKESMETSIGEMLDIKYIVNFL